jgi:hypothetical protein
MVLIPALLRSTLLHNHRLTLFQDGKPSAPRPALRYACPVKGKKYVNKHRIRGRPHLVLTPPLAHLGQALKFIDDFGTLAH